MATAGSPIGFGVFALLLIVVTRGRRGYGGNLIKKRADG
jgi:hypothetical protein